MNRRTLLVGAGSLTMSGALVNGTGAFTSTSVDRTVTARVASDDQALVALRQRGAGGRSVGTGTPERVVFSFPGLLEATDSPELGLGTNSVYEFSRDSGQTIGGQTEPVKGLLAIENRGAQPVSVFTRDATDSAVTIELYDVDDPHRTALREEPAQLATGEAVNTGVRIRTGDAEIKEFQETLVIVAEEQ